MAALRRERVGEYERRDHMKEEVNRRCGALAESDPPGEVIMSESEQERMQAFVARVMRTLWVGLLIGVCAGFVWGALLLNKVVVVTGWETLYQMEAGAFMVYWIFVGGVLGIVVPGIIAILTIPAGSDN